MAFDNVTLFGLTVDTDRLVRRLRREPEPEPEPAPARGGRFARLFVASLVLSLVATGAVALYRRRRAAHADAMARDDATSIEISA